MKKPGHIIGLLLHRNSLPDYAVTLEDYIEVIDKYGNYIGDPMTGSALVRLAAVPLPATIWLFYAGKPER